MEFILETAKYDSQHAGGCDTILFRKYAFIINNPFLVSIVNGIFDVRIPCCFISDRFEVVLCTFRKFAITPLQPNFTIRSISYKVVSYEHFSTTNSVGTNEIYF